MEMAKTDAAFSTENADDEGLSEGVQSLESHKESNSGTMHAKQASLESERSKEHLEESEHLFITALMDCYNR
jgi:hypothetical protein